MKFLQSEKEYVQALDRYLRMLHGNNLYFCKVLFMFAGDPRQGVEVLY